jgi:hypothetical protein
MRQGRSRRAIVRRQIPSHDGAFPICEVVVSIDRHGWLCGLLVCGLMVIVACAGCDLSGQYDKRMAESMQASGLRATFDRLLFADETPVNDAARAGTGVFLRLPNLIDAESKALAANDPRAQPPFMKLPNLCFAYERPVDDGAGQKLPVYIYFAAVPKADAAKKTEMKSDDLQKQIAQQLAAAFPGAAWADVPLATPTGQQITLKRIRGEGKQDFVNVSATPAAVVKADGRFDLYLVDSPSHHVLIGWRSAKGQGERQFYTASETAMGTLKSTGGAAPPAAAAPPT